MIFGRHRTTKLREKTNSGTACIVTSRTKTIDNPTADNPYPTDSTLYFECPIGTQRFKDVLYKNDGQKTIMVEKERDG